MSAEIENSIRAEQVTETLTVYQQKGVFNYGTDAMLLVDYVCEQMVSFRGKHMCDLCSGTGIIPLALLDRQDLLSAEAVEINGNAAALSEKSAAESGLLGRFAVKHADIKAVRSLFRGESFDFITCNPPYMTADSGYLCEIPDITLARHEIACTIDDVFAAAFYLLRTGGCIFLVYRTDRLSSLMSAAKANAFEIKDMCFYKTRKHSDNCDLVVCKAKKQAAEGMRIRVKTI